ncbi:hypothetical protein NEPAR06_0561 [Nematocida parisii]|nr:hypothetical protein NEPAR08_0369 [Nematocida parisii]KAI5127165.1 hypothetical protein NEPAR03_0832 [Nematocida parisii]KAI5140117.1 hypothetical protein NEPAR04_0091 [Nematocida parisii]KAI5143704.1 hypothetical protein NEPAR07_0802 [Nematocida parisii]KAI5153567.1 hypothetical protein NEPAR06_0561 [Nematocida parisii]
MQNIVHGYNSKIKTSNRFTDIPMAFIAICNLLIFMTITILISKPNYNQNISINVYKVIDTITPRILLLFISIISILYIIPLVVILLYKYFTKLMIYINYLLLISTSIYGIYVSLQNQNVILAFILVIPLVLTIFMLYRTIKHINYIQNMLKLGTTIILKNISPYTATCTLSICTGLFIAVSVISTLNIYDVHTFKTVNLSDKSTLVRVTYIVFNVALIVFYLRNSIHVLYSKLVHQHLLNKVNPKSLHKNVLIVSISRVILSTGTIFIASLLGAVVYIIQEISENFIESRSDSNRNNSALRLLILIVGFIVLIILELLSLTIDQLNGYALVYNALYGTKYSTSMKLAVDQLSAYKSSNYYNRLISVGVFPLLFSIIYTTLSCILYYGFINMNSTKYSDYTTAILVFGMGVLLSIIPIIRGTLTTVTCIEYLDGDLLNTAYPKYKIN